MAKRPHKTKYSGRSDMPKFATMLAAVALAVSASGEMAQGEPMPCVAAGASVARTGVAWGVMAWNVAATIVPIKALSGP